jgi:hypothetical protein
MYLNLRRQLHNLNWITTFKCNKHTTKLHGTLNKNPSQVKYQTKLDLILSILDRLITLLILAILLKNNVFIRL